MKIKIEMQNKMTIDSKAGLNFNNNFILIKMEEIIIYTQIRMKNTTNSINNLNKTITKLNQFIKSNLVYSHI